MATETDLELNTMTRSDLVNRIANVYSHLPIKDVEIVVKTILDAMASSIASGQRIEIRGFGSFSLSLRPARVGRNPRTGESVEVPEKRIPHFKAGKELRLRVDGALSDAK